MTVAKLCIVSSSTIDLFLEILTRRIVNFCQGIPKPEGTTIEELSDAHKHGLDRDDWFETYGNAYSKEHGTRPATIGLVLSSSPIALLAW